MDAISFLSPDDVYAGVAFFTGALLADLSLAIEIDSTTKLSLPSGGRKVLKVGWPLAVALIALFFASYPDHGAERSAWSNFLLQLGQNLFPDRMGPHDLF